MKWIVFLFFLNTSSIIAQIKIDGYVLDTNKEPLMGASVYIDGTTIGTTTDDNGYYSLSIASNINSVLVFAYFGYITKYEEIKKNNFSINVVLTEDIKELKEVVVRQNRFSRKQMLKLFREQFLGTNNAGRSCTILNEDELYFDYDNESHTFKAFSDKPLLIENNFLSYKIQYQLFVFECKFYRLSISSSDVISSLYAGTSLFTEIENSKTSLKRREKSFQGSSLQFFRNLVLNKWGKDNFLLFEGKFMTNPNDQFKIVQEKNANKISVTKQARGLHKKDFVAEFSILYKNEQSKIIFNTDTFYIDSFGLFTDYDKIYFSGEITNRRIGDMLPSNYGL